MKCRQIIAATLLALAPAMQAQVAFDDEQADTARINEMLVSVLASKPATAGDAVVAFARQFDGTPYKSGTLEGEQECLRIDLSGMDCTTFAETVLAMAMTVGERRSSWHDFVYNLQKIRYRGGEIKGYPSRLHYISEWAIDNSFRGNFSEVTNLFPRLNYAVKSLNFMSANADKYPALADSANLEAVKWTEIGLRGHRFPYVKSGDLSNKQVQAAFCNGDIVAFTTTIKNLDVAHMGVVVMLDGVPYLLHASSSAGKVVLSDIPLDVFLKRNRQFTGVRVFRITNN